MPETPTETPNAADLAELARLGAREGDAATRLFARISGALFADEAEVSLPELIAELAALRRTCDEQPGRPCEVRGDLVGAERA